MRLAHRTASFAICLLLGGMLMNPAAAETGDALIVTGDGVNVRSGPSGEASIRMRVHRNQQVIELQREGSWVRAEIAGTDGQEGWIHNSLLAVPEDGGPGRELQPDEAREPEEIDEPASPAAAQRPAMAPDMSQMIEPAAGPDRGLGELARFRETVSYLNGRATTLEGSDLFAEVKPGPGGAMRVVATDAWASVPPAGQESYANTLLDRWAATKVSAGPAILQIVDPAGEIVMEKSQP